MRTPERRQDRRHALTGHVCLLRGYADPEVFGGIVDVSARGVRLRVRPGSPLSIGDVCHVQLVVAVPSGSPEPTPIRLHGRAVLLRRSTSADFSEEVALRFDEPLLVGEAFATASPTACVARERAAARAVGSSR